MDHTYVGVDVAPRAVVLRNCCKTVARTCALRTKDLIREHLQAGFCNAQGELADTYGAQNLIYLVLFNTYCIYPVLLLLMYGNIGVVAKYYLQKI